MNKLTRIWLDNNNVTRQHIPCKVCGEPTTMKGTKLCDGCWEVQSRLTSFLQCLNAIRYVQDILATVLRTPNNEITSTLPIPDASK